MEAEFAGPITEREPALRQSKLFLLLTGKCGGRVSWCNY